MNLKDLLIKRKAAVLGKWQERVLETYPLETQAFFRRQSDRFLNPVGSTISGSLEGLYDELLGKGDYGRVRPLLDGIIRIRAIQDFSPSQAVVFLPLLKGILKEELSGEVREGRLQEEWLEVESRIDGFLLLAFDLYMECREKVFQMRIKELHARSVFSPLRS